MVEKWTDETEFIGVVRINWHRIQGTLSEPFSSRVLEVNNCASFRLIDRSARFRCSSTIPVAQCSGHGDCR